MGYRDQPLNYNDLFKVIRWLEKPIIITIKEMMFYKNGKIKDPGHLNLEMATQLMNALNWKQVESFSKMIVILYTEVISNINKYLPKYINENKRTELLKDNSLLCSYKIGKKHLENKRTELLKDNSLLCSYKIGKKHLEGWNIKRWEKLKDKFIECIRNTGFYWIYSK